MSTVKRAVGVLSVLLSVGLACAEPVGDFDGSGDVGNTHRRGSSDYRGDKYYVTGSGADIWTRADGFQFLWKQICSDLVLGTDLEFVGEGVEKNRKACIMVRQSLDADSPYVDIAVHGDGHIGLQCRQEKGGTTTNIPAFYPAPVTIRLERDGDLFSAYIGKKSFAAQPFASVTLKLNDPVYAGLAVSAHNTNILETSIFSNVTLRDRALGPGQERVLESSIDLVLVPSRERQRLYRARAKFESPNWSPDGKLLYITQKGVLCAVPVEGGAPRMLQTDGIKGCSDHAVSPDGKWIAVTASVPKESAKIFVVPSTGGAARQVTSLGPSYLHGWSRDGKTLVYCGPREKNVDVFSIPVEGGEEKRLTTANGTDDAPEFSSDGKKLYFCSERSGLMKIWRMNPDGSQQEQVTSDPDFTDWFPHPSPNGKWLVFLSYDKSVKGHPSNADACLRFMSLPSGTPKFLTSFFGGQGSINGPCWSPDSKFIAFMTCRNVIP